MLELDKRLLDYRDYNLVKQLTDQEKVAICIRDVTVENPRGHGKTKKVHLIRHEGKVISMHEDHGFSHTMDGKNQCIEAIKKFGNQSKNGFFNLAEKKSLLLSKNRDAELIKIFSYENWQAAFKFKLSRENGMPYVSIFQLNDNEIKEELFDVDKLLKTNNLKRSSNSCVNIIPAITMQNPLTAKNYCYLSACCHSIPKDFSNWQMADQGEFFQVKPFSAYINDLNVLDENFTINHNLKLNGHTTIEKNCDINIKAYFCPDFYDKTGKILHKENYTNIENCVGCPSVILSFSVLKNITNGYTRFNDPMQAIESFDYRSWGITKINELDRKSEIEFFIDQLAQMKLLNPTYKNVDNIKIAKPNLVLHFDIQNIEDFHDIGPDSFDVIPGLFWVTKQFARNLRTQFESEEFRNKLYKNDKFKNFISKINEILPENQDKYQGFKLPIDGELFNKTKKSYKFYDFKDNVEIISTNELSVKETHRFYVKDSVTGEKIKLTKNAVRFKDLSTQYDVLEIDGTSVLSFHAQEHNLTMPLGKNINIRKSCSLQEYLKNNNLNYEFGGPAPYNRKISVQLKHDEHWNDISRWKEIPEIGAKGGNPPRGTSKEKVCNIAFEPNSDIPIFKFIPSTKEIRVSCKNKKGNAVVIKDKSLDLQIKSEKLCINVLKYIRGFYEDIKIATDSIEQEFKSDECLSIAYEHDFEWYLFDKAMQRHVEDDLNKIYLDFKSEYDKEYKTYNEIQTKSIECNVPSLPMYKVDFVEEE